MMNECIHDSCSGACRETMNSVEAPAPVDLCVPEPRLSGCRLSLTRPAGQMRAGVMCLVTHQIQSSNYSAVLRRKDRLHHITPLHCAAAHPITILLLAACSSKNKGMHAAHGQRTYNASPAVFFSLRLPPL